MSANQPTPDLHASYDEYPQIEEAFLAMLDESLQPRGPDMLFDVVAGLGLPAGAHALDLGCGEGGYTLQLAERFGFRVLGVDPILRPPTGERHIELTDNALEAAAASSDDLRSRVRFQTGTAVAIPAPDASFDLIWSREMVVLVERVDAMLAECRRVLRVGGYLLIEATFATDRLHPAEDARVFGAQTAFGNNDSGRLEAAVAGSGLALVERIDLSSEWGEFSQEARGGAARRLLHAARLLRAPQHYIDAFGQANYDIMLADCYWHIYRMIGKLGGRIYVLRKPDGPQA